MRCRQVRQWFGIDRSDVIDARPGASEEMLKRLMPQAGQIVLLSGASGSGKSTLLRQLRRCGHRERRWIDLNRIEPPARRLIDLFSDLTTEQTLHALARVGLADARGYLRRPSRLSEGQRWRLRLALAMHRVGRSPASREPILLCDEFAAVLDRVTAAIVARGIRRWIDHDVPHAAALIATSHDDLVAALQPDRIVSCDFA